VPAADRDGHAVTSASLVMSFPLSLFFLGLMLGSPRPRVTLAVQEEGPIATRRAGITTLALLPAIAPRPLIAALRERGIEPIVADNERFDAAPLKKEPPFI